MRPAPDLVGILYEPQDPINVGSVVRACTNTGFAEVRLLGTRNLEFDRVAISAPHCERWIADRVHAVESWDDAVRGVDVVFAISGRRHHAINPVRTLDDALAEIASRDVARAAFVFGREDLGLPGTIADRCDAVVTLEAADNSSYNLSHAFVVVAYRAMQVLGTARPRPSPEAAEPRPGPGEIERFMQDVERGLQALGFFKGTQRENVLRTVRRVVMRAEPSRRELATLWGIFVEIAEQTARRGADR